MPIGTTIDGLNVVTSLTAQDEVPLWDKEASGEPTKKITASNLAASVKTLGSLVDTSEMNSALAGKQNTLTFDTTPTTGSTNPVTSGGIADAIAQSTASSAITFTPESGIYSNLFVRKSGNVVSINGYLTATNAFPASETLIGTIADGARPSGTVRCAIAVCNAAYESPKDFAYLVIGSSGRFSITAKSGNTYKVCYFNVTYVV